MAFYIFVNEHVINIQPENILLAESGLLSNIVCMATLEKAVLEKVYLHENQFKIFEG